MIIDAYGAPDFDSMVYTPIALLIHISKRLIGDVHWGTDYGKGLGKHSRN